jgi:hypothetical protein
MIEGMKKTVICVSSNTLTGEAEREGETHEKRNRHTTFLKIKDTRSNGATGERESPGNTNPPKKKERTSQKKHGDDHNNNVVRRPPALLFLLLLLLFPHHQIRDRIFFDDGHTKCR